MNQRNRSGDRNATTTDRNTRKAIEAEVNADFEQDALSEVGVDDLENLAEEVGLEEVYVDPMTLNTVTADDTDDNLDLDDDGVADRGDRDEQISDLPQELTQSYGTGLQGQPTDRAGRRAHFSRRDQYNEADAVLTGGDVDAMYEQANAVGDEAVGGTVATPDQDVVDELGAAVGLEMDDRSFLRTNDVLNERDDRRWELDPKSSEDYSDRRE